MDSSGPKFKFLVKESVLFVPRELYCPLKCWPWSGQHTRTCSHTHHVPSSCGDDEKCVCIPEHGKGCICISQTHFCFSSISFPLPDLPLGRDTCVTNWNLTKALG